MPANYPSKSNQKPSSARSTSTSLSIRHDPPAPNQSFIGSRTRSAGLYQPQQPPRTITRPSNANPNPQTAQDATVEAGTFLFRQKWISNETTVNYKELINALILISTTPDTNMAVVSGIRAVATLLSANPPGISEESVRDLIESGLRPAITKEVISQIKEDSSAQFSTLRETTDTQLQALKVELEDTKRLVLTSSEQITKNVTTYIENRLSPSQDQARITDLATNPQSSSRPSYAQVLSSIIGNGYRTDPIPSLIAKTLMKMRQIYVDDLSSEFRDKPERWLVDAANQAINFIPEATRQTGPENITINSVRKTRNGGLIFEFQETDAVSWLTRQNLLSQWVKLFADEGRARGNSYATLAKFVPITYNTDSPAHLEQAIFNTGIPQESVVSMKWIKPPQFRYPGQRHAHMIVMFDDPELANAAIEQGFCFHGKQVTIEKLAIEVKRCSKCQKLDTHHTARDCPDPEPTCARCAKHHPTNECKCEEHEVHCANCNEPGHMATDRNCPKFLEHNAKISEKNLENDFKFFVTKNPASHVRIGSSHRHPAKQTRHTPNPLPSLPNRPRSPLSTPPHAADIAFRESPPHIHRSPNQPTPTHPRTFPLQLNNELMDGEDPTDAGNADDQCEEEDDNETEFLLNNSAIKTGFPITGLGTTAPRPRIESSRKGSRKAIAPRPSSRTSTVGDDQEPFQTPITNFFQKKNKLVASNSPSTSQMPNTPTRQWRISPKRSQASSSHPNSQRS